MADEQPKGNTARMASIGVGAVVVALIAVLAIGSGDGGASDTEMVGSRVPKVAGTALDGSSYDIDNGRGKWVVVNFFATWCAGCINEHPELVAFDEWATETELAEVVAIVFNDPPESVASFFAAQGGGWPVLDDPEVPIAFGVSQIPETFLVAPNGQVVRHIRGEVRASDLIATIEGS